MKRKFNIWWYVWTFLFFTWLAGGICLLINEPFDLGCCALYAMVTLLFGAFVSSFVVCDEYSPPTRFFLIEVEKWIKDEYKKIYFIEEEWKQYTFIYQFSYKEKIRRTKTNYEENLDYFKTEEDTMKYILERVKSFVSLTKKEENEIIKSIKTIGEFNMEDLIKQIREDRNAN